MSKHTPGPWAVKFRNDHTAYISLGDPKQGAHKQFEIAFDDCYPSDVADARLISAAPDLLAALQSAADSLAQMALYACELDDDELKHELADLALNLRAAARRATE